MGDDDLHLSKGSSASWPQDSIKKYLFLSHSFCFDLSNIHYYFTEYEYLNAKLDDISSILDLMEKTNDSIHTRLRSLLDSNVEYRKELRDSLGKQEMDTEQDNNGEEKSNKDIMSMY